MAKDASNPPLGSKYFARDATGLVREFSALDTLLIASAMVFALVFTTTQFAWFYGNTSGANLPLSILVAAVPFVFLMLSYYAISLVIPRTGSDYVWVSRIFSPSVGFAWSLLYMLVVFLVAYVGEITAYSFAVGTIFSTSGILTNSASLVNLGNFMGTGQGGFELAILLTILFSIFAIFGTRFVKGVIYGSWIMAIIGMIVMWYILATTSQSTFEANWNNLLLGHSVSGLTTAASYQNLLSTATSLGAPSYYGGLSISSLIVALPLASLFLFGGNYISGFGGEIKNIRKSIPIALFLSLIFGLIFWSITSTLTLHTVGANWMTAVGYNWDVNAANSTAYALNGAPPSQPLMLAVAAYPNTALIYLMYVTYLVGSVAPLFAYFWIPTKYFFSWSFDRAVPSKFSSMSQRFNTPYWSVLAILVLGIVLSFVYWKAGWSLTFTVGSVVWGIAYVIPGLALMVFPFVKKNLFQQAPGIVKSKIGGFPLISLVGLITAVGFGYIGYIGYNSPAVVNKVYAAYDFELLAGVVVIGFVIYFVSRVFYKGRGIDISLAYKEIPPE